MMNDGGEVFREKGCKKDEDGGRSWRDERVAPGKRSSVDSFIA